MCFQSGEFPNADVSLFSLASLPLVGAIYHISSLVALGGFLSVQLRVISTAKYIHTLAYVLNKELVG
jgi:hypothetical protein